MSCGDSLWKRRRGSARTARHAVGRRPGCGCGPGPGGAWTTPSAPPHDHRPPPPGWEAERSAATATERASLRVVLVHRPGRQQPDPGTELGLHIQHPLTGRQQLLGQQVPQLGRRPRSPRSAPATPPPTPAAAAPDAADARTRSSPSGSSAAPIATAVCEPLCGSTPIITATTNDLPIDAGVTAAGMPYFRTCWRSRLFRATPRQGPDRLARR